MNGRDGEGKRTIKCQSADKVRVRNIHASVVLPLSDSDLSMKTLSVNYSLTKAQPEKICVLRKADREISIWDDLPCC